MTVIGGQPGRYAHNPKVARFKSCLRNEKDLARRYFWPGLVTCGAPPPLSAAISVTRSPGRRHLGTLHANGRSRALVAVWVGTVHLVHGDSGATSRGVLAGRSRMRSCSSRVGVTRRHPTPMRRSRRLPRRQPESSDVRLCARCRARRHRGPFGSRGRAWGAWSTT